MGDSQSWKSTGDSVRPHHDDESPPPPCRQTAEETIPLLQQGNLTRSTSRSRTNSVGAKDGPNVTSTSESSELLDHLAKQILTSDAINRSLEAIVVRTRALVSEARIRSQERLALESRLQSTEAQLRSAEIRAESAEDRLRKVEEEKKQLTAFLETALQSLRQLR